jgi:hypothetical protein
MNNSSEHKSWPIFIFLLVGYCLLTLLSNKFVLTEDLYYYSLGEQLTLEKIEQLFSFKSKFEWLSYVFISISILIKLLMTTTVLYTGVLLSSIEVKYKRLFRIVVQAEFLFLFVMFIRLYWISFVMDDVSLTTVSYFQPLSIINFFKSSEIETWLVYPMQLVNFFELSYWCLLAYLLMDYIKKSFWKSLEFVFSTYVVALVIWVVFVVFLTLNLSS